MLVIQDLSIIVHLIAVDDSIFTLIIFTIYYYFTLTYIILCYRYGEYNLIYSHSFLITIIFL